METRGRALAADSLLTARRIRQPIASNDDMLNAFDAITYLKGASVIHMFEQFVGPEKFRRGVQRYLKAHAYSTATAADFLSDVSAEAGLDVLQPFSSFLDQPGAPLVTAELRCEQGKRPRLDLSQERYAPLGAEPNKQEREQVWQIPVCARYLLPDGSETPDFPAHQSDFHHCRPVYETLPGWQKPLGDELPAAARGYVEFVERELGVEVTLIGTGAERTSVLTRA